MLKIKQFSKYIFILLIVPIIVSLLLSFRFKKNDQVKTPNLKGLVVYQAKKITDKKGLQIFIKTEEPSSKSKNVVLWQKPGAGTKIKPQSTIEVGISSGPVVKRVINKPEKLKYDNLDSNISGSSDKLLPNKQPTFSIPKKTLVVCIDPGHQRKANLTLEPIGPGSSIRKPGVSGGATGINSRTPEYDITLKIGLMLKQLLETKQVKVVMTRTSNDVDVNNIKRAEIANNAHADLFVRIHADGATDKSVNGISTLYPAENSWTKLFYQKSLKAARTVQSSLVNFTGRKDNGIKARSDLTGFNWSKVPVVLAEVGFLSNSYEDRLLNTVGEQQKIATGLAKGIIDFLSTY